MGEHGSDAGPLRWPPQALHVLSAPKSPVCHCPACLLSNFISTKHLVCICHCPFPPWTPYLRATWNSTTASMVMLNMSIKRTKIAPNSARGKCPQLKHSRYVAPPVEALKLRRRLTLLQRYIPFLPTIAFDATLQSSWEALSVSFQAGLLNGGPVRNPLDKRLSTQLISSLVDRAGLGYTPLHYRFHGDRCLAGRDGLNVSHSLPSLYCTSADKPAARPSLEHNIGGRRCMHHEESCRLPSGVCSKVSFPTQCQFPLRPTSCTNNRQAG